ncbi:LysR substrate-binding domain-containing protein [Phaeobacter porticola]|uniref:Transcriptional regulator, LysR family n=1 Tax=Phaeobacter porticola TaxID=1844006 RepID=A0A1L3IA64_9RHOB|nr:LysR substrate-binding domain-containing protein [Phaeobacter porticola]APG48931.1 transcriptional regulator, LysR family [Phaeobacter porticola]
MNWLRAFDASARHGSFTLAAEELGLTPSAVSYQVRGLEAQLGHKLFRREHKLLNLTRLGHAYLPVVAKAFADIDASTWNLFGKGFEQEVTLRCLTSLNLLWLMPLLGEYKAQFPASRLRVLSSSWSEPSLGESIDVDIRYGDGNWPDGAVLPLMHNEVIAVAPPSLLGSVPHSDLHNLPMIEMTGVVDTWRHFFALHDPKVTIPEPTYKVDQSLIALELASRGLGIALIADVFARPYLERGTLIRASDTALSTQHGHYLVLPSDRNSHRPEVSNLVTWLQSQAGSGTALHTVA